MTAENNSKIYGDEDPDFVVNVEGEKSGSPITYTVARTEGENVGKYPITVTITSDTKNYDLTVKNAEFEIKKADVTVTAENNSKIYGDTDPELKVTVTGEKMSKIEYTVARVEGDDVGHYDITVTLTGNTSNYNIKQTQGDFEIKNLPRRKNSERLSIWMISP